MRSVKVIQHLTLEGLAAEVEKFHNSQMYASPPVVAYDMSNGQNYRALIDYELTPARSTPNSPAPKVMTVDFDLEAHMAGIEKQYIDCALRQTRGNFTDATKLLGLTFRALRYKVKKYDLDQVDYSASAEPDTPAVVVAQAHEPTTASLPATGQTLTLAEVEKSHICHVLALCEGNRMKTARTLGIRPSTLFNKLRIYNVQDIAANEQV